MDTIQQAQALAEARKAGIDLSLIDSNLALSYEERVLRHDSALELMMALRTAGMTHEEFEKLGGASR